MTIAGVVLGAAICGASLSRAASPSCVPAEPGRPRVLLAGFPYIVQPQMTATSDGGAVIAFTSYRRSPSRFTVLALNSSGCVRWRISLPGAFPIARPLQAGPRSIVVAAGSVDEGGGPAATRVYSLSASTGRVLRRDAFPAASTGIAPTFVGDARGDVAAVLATTEPTATRGRSRPVTLKLTRPAHASRWSRQVIARSNTRPPAAAARSDGAMVVGYPRGGRFWVRASRVAGRLGRPMDAGPVARNFQQAAVALGQDGTTAAAWQSAGYSRPWRLRSAVRPAAARRYVHFAQLGSAASGRGSFFAGGKLAVHVSAERRVTVGFLAPNGTSAATRVMCANATPAGRFGPARQVADSGPLNPFDQDAMIFGPGDAAAILASTFNGDAPVNSLVRVGAACDVRSSEQLDPGAWPRQAMSDARGRVWVLGQDPYYANVPEGRKPVLLTITAPIRPQQRPAPSRVTARRRV